MAEVDTTYATIISLLPYDLVESKPGLNPNEYTVHKMNGEVGLTVIPNNVFYLVNPDPLADEKSTRNIKVGVPAMQLAQSIIQDYINALIAVDQPEKQPGLVAVKGNYTDAKVVKLRFAKEIAVAQAAQNGWFSNLVAMGDDIWSKTRSPLGISDIMRDACRSLELKREWLSPLPSELLSKCPMCKSTVNEGAIKCIACGHILDKAEYDKLMLAVTK